MSRIAVIRRVGNVERVACVIPGRIRSLGRRGAANPASDSELEAALRVIASADGRIERDAEHPGAFFLDPGPKASLYGGLDGWARTVEGYLRGRGYLPSIAVGFDRDTTYAIAGAKRGVAILVADASHSGRDAVRDGTTGAPTVGTRGRTQPLLPGIRDLRRRDLRRRDLRRTTGPHAA